MNNLNTHKVILVAIFMFISTNCIAKDRILPIPKPQVDQETKRITEKKKEIYPEKKPQEKKEVNKNLVVLQDQEIEEINFEDFNEVLSVNALSIVKIIQIILKNKNSVPRLIINISSVFI